MEYRIRFENVSTATAPAQIVAIDNELEDDFNIKRFRLDQVGWGGTIISLPREVSFTSEFDLGPDYYRSHRKSALTKGRS